MLQRQLLGRILQGILHKAGGKNVNPGLRITNAYRKVKSVEENRKWKLIYIFRRIKYHGLCRKYGYDVPNNAVVAGNPAQIIKYRGEK